MKQETVVKPVVHFTKEATIIAAGKGKRIAMIYGVLDHPRLGEQPWVSSSLVQHVECNEDGDPTLIETMNTIYKKV